MTIFAGVADRSPDPDVVVSIVDIPGAGPTPPIGIGGLPLTVNGEAVTWLNVDGVSVGVGWTYDSSTGTFTNPGDATVYRKTLTAFEWVELWTDDEWYTLETDAAVNDADGKYLRRVLGAIKVSPTVQIDSARMTAFYSWLVTNAYINEARKTVLTTGIAE